MAPSPLRHALPLGLLLLATGCARPPAGVYAGTQGSGAAGGASVALGANAAGEACTQRPTGAGQWAVDCGTWKQPSARIVRGEATTSAELTDRAVNSPWRRGLDATLDCDPPTPATIQGGEARVLRCTRRLEGFPQTAFVVLLDGTAWYADGVPPATAVMERALALNTGRISAGALGTVTESPGLAAERLARNAPSASDLAAYDDFQRIAIRANLAGEYAAAEAAYRSMAAIQRRTLASDNPALARALALQGLQISNQGRYVEATALLARAEALAVGAGGGDLTLAQVWHYQGLNLLNQRRAADALVLLRKAEAAYGPNAPDSASSGGGGNLVPTDQATSAAGFGVVETERAQAVALRMLGRGPEAEERARAAERKLALFGLSSSKAAARLLRTQAAAYLQNGRSDVALSDLQRAAERFGRTLPGTRTYAETELLLAARLAQKGDAAGADTACREATRVLRGASAGVVADRLLPCLAAFAAQAKEGKQDAAAEMFALAQLAQGGTTSQQIALVSARLAENARDPKVAKLIRLRDDANADLARLYGQRDEQGDKPDPATTKAIAETERRRDSAEQALQTASPNYAQLVQQAVSADDIRAALRPGEVFATMVLAKDTGYSFVLTQNQIVVGTIPGGEARVDALVARIRASEDDTSQLRPFDTAAASELYDLLFGDARAVLADARAMSVAPTGTLLSIPFGLLLTGPANAAKLGEAPWLINKLVVAHVPAPANFVSLRKIAGTSRASRPWFGFGDFQPVTLAQARATFPPETCKDSADLFAGVARLPGATRELETARVQLGAGTGDELVGPRFTAATVLATPLKDYRILHFATHALLTTDLACAAEPALITSAPASAPDAAGALLTASQIAGMKLDADAVLLSACNSGGPGGSAPGESLSGLARSFFYAGARSMLVTHWEVSDKVTSVLIANTLRRVRTAPQEGLATALAGAQRKLIAAARQNPTMANLAHPFFWAPVALIGEGRSVPSTAVSGI